MSDLYLELKTRIPVVAARTAVGRDRLQAAQDAVGLSNERLARQIPVSEKTWRRWKEAGEVPTYALPQVARVLRLELVEPQEPVRLEAYRANEEETSLLGEAAAGVSDLLDGQGEALVVQRQILERLAGLEAKLDGLAERRPARRRQSSR